MAPSNVPDALNKEALKGGDGWEMMRRDIRRDRKKVNQSCLEDIVNLFTHCDSWQMTLRITKILPSPKPFQNLEFL